MDKERWFWIFHNCGLYFDKNPYMNPWMRVCGFERHTKEELRHVPDPLLDIDQISIRHYLIQGYSFTKTGFKRYLRKIGCVCPKTADLTFLRRMAKLAKEMGIDKKTLFD